uniref:Uncharacterized protein n=1 Tax=Rhodosorus marinus TaxID=101924 RepID=A0A7S3A1D9_9RHOD|mmetsp:Transcript_41126/g.162451  ORF Transcript_41126/g.162451 Transcript_41126/m.162451 type:complete len:302 (+) Transcript_41126:140-1045(+)
MKVGVSLLVIVVLAAAAVEASFPPPPKKCEGTVPGWLVEDKQFDCGDSCKQCCDHECKLVTCNKCDPFCGKTCVDHAPKDDVVYTDITCNVDDHWNMECILCNCPDSWKAGLPKCVEILLKKKLFLLNVRTRQCRQARRLRSLSLLCGDPNKDWKHGFEKPLFQCKNALSGKCIISDRSFPNVKITTTSGCKLEGHGPKCDGRLQVYKTDCENCDKTTSVTREGLVKQITKKCLDNGAYCRKIDEKCDVEFGHVPCTPICKHINFLDTCDKCKVGRRRAKPRTPPLCIAGPPDVFKPCKYH